MNKIKDRKQGIQLIWKVLIVGYKKTTEKNWIFKNNWMRGEWINYVMFNYIFVHCNVFSPIDTFIISKKTFISHFIHSCNSKGQFHNLSPNLTRSLVPGWTHLRVHQMSSCGSWDRRARSRLPTLERGRGLSWKPRD